MHSLLTVLYSVCIFVLFRLRQKSKHVISRAAHSDGERIHMYVVNAQAKDDNVFSKYIDPMI